MFKVLYKLEFFQDLPSVWHSNPLLPIFTEIEFFKDYKEVRLSESAVGNAEVCCDAIVHQCRVKRSLALASGINMLKSHREVTLLG